MTGKTTHPKPQKRSVGRVLTVHDGVTVAWLADAFDKDTAWVRRRMAGVPALNRQGGARRYEFVTAVSRLAKPDVDITGYLAKLDPKDLPVALQPAYWTAQKMRMQVEKEAKTLWASEDVIEVLGAVFKAIRGAMQLWPDTVEDMEGLDDAQRKVLIAEADKLQDEIFRLMNAMASARSTPSIVARLDEAAGCGRSKIPGQDAP